MSGSDEGSADRLREFTQFRQRMNQRILAEPNQVVRRFFALDTQTYQAGALDVKTKELLGLVASMVLRCDDCISYHVAQCKEAGVSREEFFETFSVGLVVGGSIVIPHLRRAVDFLDQLEGGAQAPLSTHTTERVAAARTWGSGFVKASNARAAHRGGACVRALALLDQGRFGRLHRHRA
ncbi:carboxymuconolactone decarboxylase [Xanthomonas euvesicatoria pv. citrumelo F1]|nr:carboxymuconolactone decarboxylase [Xanthomonas euvesicatoria pv. citrumelo F1]